MQKIFWSILVLIFSLIFQLTPTYSVTFTTQQQQQMTPEQALEQLELGNQRFLNSKIHQYDYSALVLKTAEAQHPFAVVLSCLDSRSSPDILFDQGLANIFVARIAGNVVDKKILGSMEYATKVTGSKLIVVMGHTNCGAIKGACDNVKLGNLTDVLQAIQPAVQRIKQSKKNNFSCKNPVTIDAIAKQNVLDQMQAVLSGSSIIKELVQQKTVMIVGAMQDLTTGKVTFFNAQGTQL